jgi:hypothetical protein
MPPILPAIAREGRDTNSGALDGDTLREFVTFGRTCWLSAHSALGVLADLEGRLRFVAVTQEIGDQGADQSGGREAELGRLLAAADGYLVVASDGTHLGRLDHVRYQRYADHPDEIVVRRRPVFPRRRRALPFSAVETIRARDRTIVLRLDQSALERSRPV